MEKGIIVGVNTQKNEDLFVNEMKELRNLCEACNIEIVEEVTQNLDEQNIKSYIGKGKLEELKIAINATDADVIICNDELSPSQISNLQNILDVLGHPVLYYPANAGINAICFNSYYCSSDDEKILDVAEKEGNKVIILGAWGCGAFKNSIEIVVPCIVSLRSMAAVIAASHTLL